MQVVYLLIGLVVIVAVVIGVYWYSQKSEVTELSEIKKPALEVKGIPEISDIEKIAPEIDALLKDISELETVAEDKSLDTLKEDLSALTEETPSEKELPSTPAIDISDIESTEKELSTELEGILNDLTDLEGFEEDTSLDELDTSLSGLAK